LGEDTQVVADGRLRQTDRSGQVADARLALGRGLDQAEQTQTGRVRQCLEDTGQAVRVVLVVDLPAQGGGLRQNQFSERSTHVLHPSTASIDSTTYHCRSNRQFFLTEGSGW